MAENGRLLRSTKIIEKSVPAQFLGTDLNYRDSQELLYQRMSELAGPIGTLWYGGGDSDILPIQMTDVLVVVDKAALFNEKDSASFAIDNKLRHLHSPRIRQFLAGTEGSTVRDAMKSKIKEGRRKIDYALRENLGNGYRESLSEEHEESIVDIMANLDILGVSLEEVRLRKIPEGYHMSFSMDGKRKHIFYFPRELPSTMDDLVSTTEREKIVNYYNKQVRGRVEVVGPVAVLKKADEGHVVDNFLLLNPDKIIFDSHNSIPFKLLFGEGQQEYELVYLSDSFGTLTAYGYSDPREGVRPVIGFRRIIQQ